ncbi:MAG: lipoyl(octanoyl) transferase LipB [Bacteroidales bacterium]|jgi:lipoyl(octanoyl) transferase|nr:lipoyl(octanoyl) transferase LipB [Bacteroidales bacterium]
MQNVIFKDLGTIDYKKAWDFQEKLFNEAINQKIKGNNILNYLLFCEHPHVYTLGRNGKKENLLISEEQIRLINASYYHINRGGDITYHGPGQIVVYPIFDLEELGLTLKQYIENLEQIIIDCLADYNITAGRLAGATGVWLDSGIKGRERKICAIGVHISRFVTMHGLAFNVNTNLDYFNYINPCGFVDKGVTSMKEELKKEQSLDEVKQNLLKHFTRSLHLSEFVINRSLTSV